MSIYQSLKEQFKTWNKEGVNVPLASDNGVPSMTLLFAYISFLATLLSLIYLHIFPDRYGPTIMSVITWVIALVIYRMRRIEKMKFDLDNRSFELDSEDEEETQTPKKENNEK